MRGISCDGEQQKAAKSLFLLDFLVTIVLIAVDVIAIVAMDVVFQLGKLESFYNCKIGLVIFQ